MAVDVGAGAAGGQPVTLPDRYFALMAAGIEPVAARLAAKLPRDLATLEAEPGWRHFPSAILVASVLATHSHSANPRHGDAGLLALAVEIGDLLADESERGTFLPRLDSHRDAYMWLEAYRLLEPKLSPERRERWRREIERQVTPLARGVAERVEFPRYQSPFIGTSPNHYALWSSTLHLAGRIFGKPNWEQLGARVLHRFAAQEQTPDGYWGEHSDAGPTPGYDFLTLTGVALYGEQSGDSVVREALRRSTEFHLNYTFPDGTPVDVINDRNRYWGVSAWGHFGFSHLPEGRRYAAFLTQFLREGAVGLEDLGRLAQNALYFHAGPMAPIPQDEERSSHRMSVPAGIRKTGPWVVALSGLVSTQAVTNQFYLDRQGHVSIFHEELGLIVTGAGGKRQPELATFWERFEGQVYHLPTSGHLRVGEDGDRLGLAYHRFFSELRVTAAPGEPITLCFRITGKGTPPEEARLTLQLCLQSGESLETAAGRRLTPGREALALEADDLGAWVRHRGWRLGLPPESRLLWPVYPFNPYTNGPETSLERAVAALSVPLRFSPRPGQYVRPDEQESRFTLEASPG